MKVSYQWLQEYVGESMPSLEKVDELLTFHAFEIDGIEKVGEHDVLDVKILPDRSSDCLSHRGIAHELAALIGTSLAHDPLKSDAALEPKTDNIQITIENPENCRRFATALVTGVTIKESPDWLKERLQALGQRSINNVVDATNYVMFALGQPLHAYDAEKFPHEGGVWKFGVRMAREGEEVTTLGDVTHTLTPATQLIVDGAHDAPAGIAGIKGGKYAEIHAGTTAIILEAANFNPQITRKSAQLLRLQTDASKRFENNISPNIVPYALTEVVALIIDIAGGTCGGYADVYPHKAQETSVFVSEEHIARLLGITIPTKTIEDIFKRLNFTYTKADAGWTVVGPKERTDVCIAEDVIADIGRVYGYSHVTSVVPETVPLTEINARHYYSEKVRDLLIAEGFSEVITSSFRKKDDISLLNALASDKGCLRSTLAHNVREALDRNMPNADLLALARVEVFEIGTVFRKHATEKGVVEHVSLAFGVRTKQQGYTPKDDERLKEVASKLEQALQVSLNGTIEKGVFECNFTEVIAQLPVPTAYAPFTPGTQTQFVPFSTYPFVSRDIALWAPEGTTATDIESLIRNTSGALLHRVTLFDEFTKEGKTSYAFRLIFQSMERTLNDIEVGEIMEKLYITLKAQGFEIR